MEHLCGTVEEGKCADLLVVDGDPLADIAILQDRSKLALVMKDGKVMVNTLGLPQELHPIPDFIDGHRAHPAREGRAVDDADGGGGAALTEVLANGARLSYEEYGAGPPVVLVHGLGGTGTDIWKKRDRRPGARLPRRRLRPPRLGRRARSPPAPTRSSSCRRTSRRSSASSTSGPSASSGHSLGGGIALAVGGAQPGAGSGRRRRRRGHLPPGQGPGGDAGTRGDGRDRGDGRRRRDGRDERARPVLPRRQPGGVPGADLAARLGERRRLRGPVPGARRRWTSPATSSRSRRRCCSSAGELDGASPATANEENAARIPGAELVVIPDCAHIIPWEKPDDLIASVRPFLARHLR